MYQIKDTLDKKNFLLYLIVVSICIKFFLLFMLGAKTFSDGRGYIHIAEAIYHNSFILPLSFTDDMPITPYVYSLFVFLKPIFGIAAYSIPNIILASFTIFVIYKITLTIFDNVMIANIAAIIVCIYPFFNFYSITILTEIIFIFFLYSSMYFAVKFIKELQLKDIILFSIIFAIASLTRASTVPMYVFFMLLFIFILIKENKKRLILKYLICGLLAYGFVMLPWIIRNYNISNELTLTTPSLNGGLAFYMGNNPMNKSGGGINFVDYDTLRFEKMTDQKKAAELATKESIEWIKENPYDWVKLEINKFIRFYRLTIYAKQYDTLHYKMISILSYGVILIFFIIGLYQSRKLFWLYSPMILFMLLLTGVHMVLFASVRYRLPVEPFMIIIASSVIYNLLHNKLIKK